MAIEDSIQCPSCRRAVVPQLWVDDRDQLVHTRLVHLCPFCGAVLRQSGGQPKWSRLVFALALLLLGLLFIYLMALRG